MLDDPLSVMPEMVEDLVQGVLHLVHVAIGVRHADAVGVDEVGCPRTSRDDDGLSRGDRVEHHPGCPRSEDRRSVRQQDDVCPADEIPYPESDRWSTTSVPPALRSARAGQQPDEAVRRAAGTTS